jgi:hypothetical protein
MARVPTRSIIILGRYLIGGRPAWQSFGESPGLAEFVGDLPDLLAAIVARTIQNHRW